MPDRTVTDRGIIWDPERPLVRAPGKLMSDMTLDEYSSVIEDLSRWQLAEQWADQIKRGKLTKKQVFEKFADAPHAYVEDMVAKMKEKLKEKPNGG